MPRRQWLIVVASVVALFAMVPRAHANMFKAADRLVADQQLDGSWPGEGIYTGHIVPGLVRAYQVTGNNAYKTAAEAGGNYILNTAPPIPGGSSDHLLGEESYAMQTLSVIDSDPMSNAWRTQLTNFYGDIANLYPGGTAGYIAALQVPPNEPSTATVSIAHHVLAAHYVGAADRAIWRGGLVNALATINDGAAWYPVMGLGASVWALADTGAMDTTLVDPGAAVGSTWYGVRLMDLAPRLLSDQEPTTGGFYWRFDHLGGYGYTEDTIFGTLGLISADTAAHIYAAAIVSGMDAVASGIGDDGTMKDHLWAGSWSAHVYAGEALRLAIPEPATLSIFFSGVLLCARRRRRRR